MVWGRTTFGPGGLGWQEEVRYDPCVLLRVSGVSSRSVSPGEPIRGPTGDCSRGGVRRLQYWMKKVSSGLTTTVPEPLDKYRLPPPLVSGLGPSVVSHAVSLLFVDSEDKEVTR